MTQAGNDSRTQPHWRREGIPSAFFHYVATHEWASKAMGKLWGTDTDIWFADIATLKDTPEGSAILDVPSGGGVAFRGIPTDRQVRYVAVDIAEAQLDRARAEAERLNLPHIEFLQESVDNLPFDSDTFDVAVSYNGLHCFPDPRGAIFEIARVLRPGGLFRCSTVVRGGLLSRLLIGAAQRGGGMGPVVVGPGQIAEWLVAAGFEDVETRKSGLLAYFTARKKA